MATDDELKAQILRYHFVEHWRVGTIASQLGVHHSTVERVLGEAGVERERQRPRRPSKLDPYMAFITETLERFPTLTAARLFDMVKARGYPTPAFMEKRFDRRVLLNNCRFEFKIASHRMMRTQNSKHGNLISGKIHSPNVAIS